MVGADELCQREAEKMISDHRPATHDLLLFLLVYLPILLILQLHLFSLCCQSRIYILTITSTTTTISTVRA
jgi:hypothetical protein